MNWPPPGRERSRYVRRKNPNWFDGRYGGRTGHSSVLRTLSDMYDLPPLGEGAKFDSITGVWWRVKRGGN